jgi:hypothetical protein
MSKIIFAAGVTVLLVGIWSNQEEPLKTSPIEDLSNPNRVVERVVDPESEWRKLTEALEEDGSRIAYPRWRPDSFRTPSGLTGETHPLGEYSRKGEFSNEGFAPALFGETLVTINKEGTIVDPQSSGAFWRRGEAIIEIEEDGKKVDRVRLVDGSYLHEEAYLRGQTYEVNDDFVIVRNSQGAYLLQWDTSTSEFILLTERAFDQIGLLEKEGQDQPSLVFDPSTPQEKTIPLTKEAVLNLIFDQLVVHNYAGN